MNIFISIIALICNIYFIIHVVLLIRIAKKLVDEVKSVKFFKTQKLSVKNKIEYEKTGVDSPHHKTT